MSNTTPPIAELLNRRPEIKVTAECVKVVESTRQAMVDFGKAMAGMRPLMEQFQKAGKALYDTAYQNYLNDGAIYGESHKGFMRWFGEVQEAAAAQRKAQEIRLHHESLRQLKEKLKRP